VEPNGTTRRRAGIGSARFRGLPERLAVILYLVRHRGVCCNAEGRKHPGGALNAIAEAHKAANFESPTYSAMVKNTMKGIRRTNGTAPAQKTAALTDDIRAMVGAIDAAVIGSRDRAMILLGFAGAFRRSELIALDVDDCAFGTDGLTINLRRSKTDQQGAGRKIGIPYGSNPETCPVRTVQKWIELAGIVAGPLFRSISRHGLRLGGSVVADRRGARGEKTRGPRRARPREVRGPLAESGPCDQRRDCGRVRALDHEPDRTPERPDGPALHQRRQSVPGL